MRYWIICACILCLFISPAFAQDERTPYAAALERILSAEANHSTVLNLANLGLTDLPPELFNLSELEILYLSSNSLSSLPPEIANLHNLTYLNLGTNALSNLPPEIGDLHKLQSLWLDNNGLTDLPPEIGNLHKLQSLYLFNNDLSSLPSEIGNLTCLNTLILSGNHLRRLPNTLGQLENLVSSDSCGENLNHPGLNISNNPLISPPAEVLAAGTPAILAYLRQEARWHLQRLIITVAAAIGVLALFILGLRWRYLSTGKPKKKRA